MAKHSDGDLLDQLVPYSFLGGYNAAELWPTVNIIMLSWGLYVFAPRWKYTPTLSLIGPLFHALIYTGGLLSQLFSAPADAPPIDFSTLEGVVMLFQDPNGVFIGWIHYVVFDALVGRMVVLDSIQRGASLIMHVVFVVPCIILCLLFGPTGWLLYTIGREIMLPMNKPKEASEQYHKAKIF